MKCGWSENKTNVLIPYSMWNWSDLFTYRFHSDSSMKGNGFQMEYKALDYNIPTCGGNYSNSSGVIMSQSYPNPYPNNIDCINLVSQPNGTFINISFNTMDINCHNKGSDYIEMRDGISEDSPLMGKFCGNGSNLPPFLQTTQNYLRIRWIEVIESMAT